MEVVNIDGERELLSFDKITHRLRRVCYDLGVSISHEEVVQKIIPSIVDGITTEQIDAYLAETCASRIIDHLDYGIIASRLMVTSLHKRTEKKFSKLVHKLYHYIHPYTGEQKPLISKKIYDITQKNKQLIDNKLIYNNDYLFDYFGIKTLKNSYLIKIDGKVVETPQHLFMRVAIGIHGDDFDRVFETYNMLSKQQFIHATPTLFNAGTENPQLASCFLLDIEEDSIKGIYNTLFKCATISKGAGGIGLSVNRIRCKGSYIYGSNGYSNGIVPMLKNFNETARYVDQGGGKRKGSFAVYLEPWHGDILEFLELKKNHGKEEMRARDLFYGLWVCDLFMRRVEEDKDWSLFCPHQCPDLGETYGDEFDVIYEKYEKEGRGIKNNKSQRVI